MINKGICIIGGYDNLSKLFFSEICEKKSDSIFINLNEKNIKKRNVFNMHIFQLKKIFNLIKKKKINNIVFLGKISRPNLSIFKNDGVIDKYLPILFDSFKKGDGSILKVVIKIFKQNNLRVISPKKLSTKLFFNEKEISSEMSKNDKNDMNKSVNILNDLSKYDIAQSIVCINGYIIGIEAAEGTDSLLKRTFKIRDELGQLNMKAGLLTKIPKKNQSLLVDLPVIGPKTVNMVKKANLNGIAINKNFTMVENKTKTLRLMKINQLCLYDLS